MRAFIYLFAMGGLLCAAPSFAKTHVFACEPEWAALVDHIGGDDVKSYAATHAMQDPHHIRARPSLLAKMRKSDMVICSGAALEIGWLPILQQKAGKASTRPDGAFYIEAAQHIPVLNKQNRVDRSMGDVHPQGNPHVHLNPHHIATMAAVVNEKLQQLDAKNAVAIQARYTQFITAWHAAIAVWEQRAATFHGKHIIIHHASWMYLSEWLGLTETAMLEPVPGLPPTAKHLHDVVHHDDISHVSAIIRTPYDPEDASLWLSEKTGIPAIVLPYTVGGDDNVTDLFSLFDVTLTRLEGVLHAQR